MTRRESTSRREASSPRMVRVAAIFLDAVPDAHAGGSAGVSGIGAPSWPILPERNVLRRQNKTPTEITDR